MRHSSKIRKWIIILLAAHCYYFGHSQKTMAELRDELYRAKNPVQKADACFNLSRRYSDALKIDSALYYAELIKLSSEQVKYETGVGKYYLARAMAYFFRGQTGESRKNALQAIQIFLAQQEYSFLGIGYWQLATTEGVAGLTEQARTNYWSSAYYLVKSGDDQNLFRTYFWLGRNYENSSDYDSSASYFIKALKLAEKLKDTYRIYSAAVELGEAFLNMRDLTRANQYLEYGLKHKTPTANKVGVWSETGNYAVCLSLLHDFSKADSVISEFEMGARQFNHVWGWIMLDKLKGILAYEKQDYTSAKRHLSNAYSKIGQIADNKTDIKDIVFNLGKTEFKTGQYDDAIVHLREAAQLSGDIRTFVEAMEADYLLTEAFERINKPDSALYYFRNYSKLRESVLSLEKQKMIAEVTTRYQSEKNEQEIRMLQKESEASSYLVQLQRQQIEKQMLADDKKSQQLELASRQNEINRLEAAQKNLAIQSQQREISKKQKELESISKESQLRRDIALKEGQRKEIAYAAVLAILVLGSVAFYRYRQSRRLSNQLTASLASLKDAQDQLIRSEKEKAAENLRVRISRDIHDEVGATLSGVALFSEIAKEKMRQHRDDDAMEYLEHISMNSKEMVDKMSDIVWAIDPINDGFGSMIEKLQNYTANLCAGKNIQFHSEIPESLKDYQPPMDIKRNLYLFIKEAVNNAVKYSGGKNIWLSLRRTNGEVTVEIKDDGVGFDPDRVMKGNGLRNMRARATHLDGHLQVHSGYGNGTIVNLQFEFHPIGGEMTAV